MTSSPDKESPVHQPCEESEKSILAEGTMPVTHGLESNNLDMFEEHNGAWGGKGRIEIQGEKNQKKLGLFGTHL